MVIIPLNFRTRAPRSSQSNALTTKPAIAAAEDSLKIFAIYLIAILMYTVASPGPLPDHDPNPRGGGQLPNSTLTSGISHLVGGASPHIMLYIYIYIYIYTPTPI